MILKVWFFKFWYWLSGGFFIRKYFKNSEKPRAANYFTSFLLSSTVSHRKLEAVEAVLTMSLFKLKHLQHINVDV